MPFSADAYNKALTFAAQAHGAQLVPGTRLPYIVHVAGVAAEVLAAAQTEAFDVELCVSCALLHDTLEDTATTAATLEQEFGPRVLAGVTALSKDPRLPKEQRMADSLSRILAQPPEVARVKLADRINNLKSPPAAWSTEKRSAYRAEAQKILSALGHVSPFLSKRLHDKIDAYAAFLDDLKGPASPAAE